MERDFIYLDHAATTPMCQEAILTYEKISKTIIGNSSSVHSFGRQALKVVDRSREIIANYIGGNYNEIIFTSGATEANNLAILGLVKKFKDRKPDFKPHLITSNVEHASVLETMKYLESSNQAEVTFLPVDSLGMVDLDKVKDSIKPNTILISIIWVNNETGSINPIRKIGKLVIKENERREKDIWVDRANGSKEVKFNTFEKIYFHVDATQALITQEINVVNNFIDLMTLSGHKLYGPKGIGLLYVKSGTPLLNLLYGGDQELSLRPGTLPVNLISALTSAFEFVFKNKKELSEKFASLNKYLRDELLDFKNTVINSDLENSSAHILNFSILGQSAEILLHKLDNLGFAVSTGSACSAGGVSTSHVIAAITTDQRVIDGAIRVSFGKDTQIEDLKKFVETLKKLI